MKTINERFTNQEFHRMKKIKGKLNWHDSMVLAYNILDKAIKKEEIIIDKIEV
jgi:hypothetical protein